MIKDEQKPVMAILVKVLKDKPKGIPKTEATRVLTGKLNVPNGPILINGQWW